MIMARNFDGTNDYVRFNDDASLTLSSATGWTVAGWIRPTDLSGAGLQYFISWGAWFAAAVLTFYIDEPTDKIVVVVNNVSTCTSSTAVTEGVWVHITLTFASNTLTLYFDNVSKGTDNSVLGDVNVNERMYFGARSDLNATRFFPGDMAEWAKWDVALNNEQRTALVNGVRPPEIGARPVWYLPMFAGLDEEIAGLTVTNNGTTIAEHPPKIVPHGQVAVTTFATSAGGPKYYRGLEEVVTA